MPGCPLHVDARVVVPLNIIAGQAIWSVPIPSLGALYGQSFFLQAFVIDGGTPSPNPLGATTSNAAECVVGQ